jgi:hypothetical protein
MENLYVTKKFKKLIKCATLLMLEAHASKGLDEDECNIVLDVWSLLDKIGFSFDGSDPTLHEYIINSLKK